MSSKKLAHLTVESQPRHTFFQPRHKPLRFPKILNTLDTLDTLDTFEGAGKKEPLNKLQRDGKTQIKVILNYHIWF